MAKTRKIGRDAKTGKFIPVKVAKQSPNTTSVETIKIKKLFGLKVNFNTKMSI